MELKKELEKALIELRKDKKRKFDQTVDLIIKISFLLFPIKLKKRK